MKKLFAILLVVALMATMSVTAFAEESTTNITLVLTDSYGDGWETATIKACLVKSDGSEEILMEVGGDCPVLQIPAGQWHTIESLETGTVIFEAKDGAFAPLSEEDIFKG